MPNYDDVKDREFNFATLFVIANRLDTLLDRALSKFDITSRQWFLSIIINNVFDEGATMQQAARQMGCSHQNVKQVALKLKQKGLISMEKDMGDRRITRMRLTNKSDMLWQDIAPTGEIFMDAVFDGISANDMAVIRRGLHRILENIERLDTK